MVECQLCVRASVVLVLESRPILFPIGRMVPRVARRMGRLVVRRMERLLNGELLRKEHPLEHLLGRRRGVMPLKGA